MMVEDELEVAEVGKRLLERRGYKVIIADTVKRALTLLSKHSPDLLILDIMLPDGSGFEVCEHFRMQSEKPVLFLSAKSEVDDKIIGLKHGADYYLTKPYNFGELYAVVERLLERDRRYSEKRSNTVSAGGITLDSTTSSAAVDGKTITLTKTEFAILFLLMRNKNRETDKEHLYETVWGSSSNGDTRVLSKHISNLRQKTDCENSKNYDILSSYGKGYMFVEL